ncbi:MAG: NAD(P)/FAD-dependent oxidoreductase [Gammaproteobacteria bacterium]|nr:NAD(P)/FAD-dependent oxidoreductase [Gammaproteobacteria bacterium]
MTSVHDVVIVGAGFAGLACAKRAAELDLSVLVIDRQPSPGRYIHTTGILVQEAQSSWPAPAELTREISRIRLYAPSHRHVELESTKYRFFATDTVGLMKFLVDETRRAGAEVRFNCEFNGVNTRDCYIELNDLGIKTRYLVGADGVNSRVARSAGLDHNTRLLKGLEWEYEPNDLIDDCLHCFVDPAIAPGYIGWVIPGVGATQVGLAVNQRQNADIDSFVASIDSRFDLSALRVTAKRGGMIPINGLLRNFFTSQILLLGDAAGMVSPLTAGGIHRSYRYGKLAANAIADYLQDSGTNPGIVVRAAYDDAIWKYAARWSFDNLPLTTCMEVGVSIARLFRRVAGKVFYDRFAID